MECRKTMLDLLRDLKAKPPFLSCYWQQDYGWDRSFSSWKMFVLLKWPVGREPVLCYWLSVPCCLTSTAWIEKGTISSSVLQPMVGWFSHPLPPEGNLVVRRPIERWLSYLLHSIEEIHERARTPAGPMITCPIWVQIQEAANCKWSSPNTD